MKSIKQFTRSARWVFAYVAVAVVAGNINLSAQSNIVANSSFEGPAYDITPWQIDTDFGHQVGYAGAADGTNWIYYGGPLGPLVTNLFPVLGTNQLGQTITNGWYEVIDNESPPGNLWQDLNTVPGRIYDFSFQSGGDGTQVRVHWGDQILGDFGLTVAQGWFKTNYQVTATQPLTRIRVENLSGRQNNLTIDDFRVVWLEEQPSIVQQPISRTGYEQQTARFVVKAQGAPTLQYHWYFNDKLIETATENILTIDGLSQQNAGAYQVVVENSYGSITSRVVQLKVEAAPLVPVITAQPSGMAIPEGYVASLNCAAVGEAPLSFQWYHDDAEVEGGKNATLVFSPVQQLHAGTYRLKVSNIRGTVTSLPAVITVSPDAGGGYVMVKNLDFTTHIGHPVYDVDGVTKLAGTNYLVQVYVGQTAESMRAAGQPMSFYAESFPDTAHGIFFSSAARVPDIPAGENVFVQLKVWNVFDGLTYEAARASGGKFGFSPVMQTSTYQIPSPPVELNIPDSFSLQDGLPLFTTGLLSFSAHSPNGGVEWELQGEAGFRYLIERRTPPNTWDPFLIITNTSGVTQFEDPLGSQGAVRFYRARILD
ncbi:hypothetical protein GC207_15050 [bacterium]|nr:hypothetical protein [bacterium]